MRFYVEKTCVDYNGRLYQEGETVELNAGRHSAYLRPLDVEDVSAAEVAEAAEAAGDTAADAAADKEHCNEAVAEVVAATPKKKSTRKKAEG